MLGSKGQEDPLSKKKLGIFEKLKESQMINIQYVNGKVALYQMR